MRLRKEQVLLLAVLLLALWQYKSLGAEPPPVISFQVNRQEYTAQPIPRVPLVEAAGTPVSRRDLFREPSETEPLPPRPLPFPERAPLSLVALPLVPGPDLAHVHLLAISGQTVTGVTLAAGGGGAAESAPPAPEPAAAGQDQGWERFTRTYDQIKVVGLNTPFLGIIDHPDKIALERTRDFSGVTVRFRTFHPSTGKLGAMQSRTDVERVDLARTLRNEVERRKRDLPDSAGHLLERERLVDWMLEQAREEAWVYDEAMAQADRYLELTNRDVEGYRLKVRVLRARGDLAGEYALYRGLEGRLAESSFRHEGLGIVAAMLGLWQTAEADLRKAVELAPADPRPLSSLIDFLLLRGRAGEAAALADRAAAALGTMTGANDRARVLSAVVSARLAVGDLSGARSALSNEGLAVRTSLALLPGAVDYAGGDAESALAAFRQASATLERPEALLGQAAAMVLLGRWQDAQAAFDAVVDQAPLLRGRAWAGLGLLHLRIGQREQALQYLDRSLEADPLSPYAHYLRGRLLREMGQYPQAVEALQSALRLRDDFLHALAEMAMTRWAMAEDGRGREAAVHLAAAMRYADRVVELQRSPSREFLELQGTLRFLATDVRGAEESFAAARDAAGDDQGRLFGRIGLAICEYARGRTEEARVQLQRIASDLPLDHAMRRHAETTLALIDDHSQKERLEDRFERTELGAIWAAERDGALGPQVIDERLVFRGSFSRAGEVWAERSGAVQKAGRFLALQVKMQVGPGHRLDGGFVGLRLENAARQGTAVPDFRAQIGLQDGKPWLRIEDGRSADPQKEREREPVRDFEAAIPDYNPRGTHTLELRVEPRDDQGRQFRLLCLWNGALVHERPLTGLRADSAAELRTMLVVTGARGGAVDAAFDDYVLQRRKEK